MSSQTGLGKGLNALFRETTGDRNAEEIRTLPLKVIEPNKGQPRKTFNEAGIQELAQSIRQHGLLQPIIVRPIQDGSPGRYEIIAGERRYRACRLAQLLEVPVIVKKMSDEASLAAALVENIQRQDLNPIEEALALQTLKDAYQLSQEDVALRVGKSRSAIANCLRLLLLPVSMHADIIEGLLTAGHARALLAITDGQVRNELHKKIVEQNLSVREAEGLASRWKERGTLAPDTGTEAARDQQPGGESGKSLPGNQSGKGQGRRLPQAALLLQFQEKMTNQLQAKVKITGKETKGKISISYASKEQLHDIMRLLSQESTREGHDG